MTQDQVTWVPITFNESFKPGDKDFDFDINEISYSPDRAQAVDFSESYYDVSPALVAVKGTPITGRRRSPTSRGTSSARRSARRATTTS